MVFILGTRYLYLGVLRCALGVRYAVSVLVMPPLKGKTSVWEGSSGNGCENARMHYHQCQTWGSCPLSTTWNFRCQCVLQFLKSPGWNTMSEFRALSQLLSGLLTQLFLCSNVHEFETYIPGFRKKGVGWILPAPPRPPPPCSCVRHWGRCMGEEAICCARLASRVSRHEPDPSLYHNIRHIWSFLCRSSSLLESSTAVGNHVF